MNLTGTLMVRDGSVRVAMAAQATNMALAPPRPVAPTHRRDRSEDARPARRGGPSWRRSDIDTLRRTSNGEAGEQRDRLAVYEAREG